MAWTAATRGPQAVTSALRSLRVWTAGLHDPDAQPLVLRENRTDDLTHRRVGVSGRADVA